MADIEIRWADAELKKFGDRLKRLETEFPKVLPRIVNQVGARAKTQVVRNLTAQTGLPRATIFKAVDVSLAGGKKLSYEMVTRGGNVRLKFLSPRETRAGVSAVPWGKRQVFGGTFMHGGKFPNRHGGNFGGHVMRRLNPSGTKLTQARSGMFIPQEMTTGRTVAAFEKVAAPLLKQRVEAALDKLIP